MQCEISNPIKLSQDDFIEPPGSCGAFNAFFGRHLKPGSCLTPRSADLKMVVEGTIMATEPTSMHVPAVYPSILHLARMIIATLTQL